MAKFNGVSAEKIGASIVDALIRPGSRLKLSPEIKNTCRRCLRRGDGEANV